ncbi:hypothetical protein PFISCL1PPCAC_27815 [Pristionchus fissidentatus]|uniref:Carboxylic ester hydrolase n=1 Tax=Pristionchus fissidentatus TaxID=1538716 RepID=A0AAV5X0G4_9BILA|nr:hypothetical protein PFISCL1PPCAC_27815 [Pristionchus fissidentatus]
MPLFSFNAMGNSRSAPASSPTISTRDGKIQGKRLVDEAAFKADAYLGIPYAQPPLGDLRFRKPVAPNKWTDTRECFEHPKKCVQVPFELLCQLDKDHPASEDCLYLSVFCPGDYTLKDDKYPVMVWIHGGGFTCGSTKAYGDVGICDGLVRHGIVVVTVQYRLGVAGFFSTGDEVCPGNFGLWDQLEALKWVQENIVHFGGDNENVTVFGQSAGGASTDLLSLSPKTKGLMHKAIPMAGNACAPWSHQTSITQFSREYAETKLGIRADSSQELIDQLRRLPADRLATALEMKIALGEANLGFCPVIDGDFLPHPVAELRLASPALPVMAGVTALECGLFIPDASENINEDQLRTTVEAMLPEHAIQESSQALIKLYKEVALRKQPKNELWRAIVEMTSDRLFNIPTLETLKQCAKKGAKTYMYNFDYYNPKCFVSELAKATPAEDASHCAELAYVFNAGVAAAFTFCDHDKQVAGLMMRAISNFAKRGDPNEEGEQRWLPCDAQNPERHMVIDLKPKMEDQYLGGRCSRWIELQKHV